MKTTVIPVGNRILLKQAEELPSAAKSDLLIIIPESAKEKPSEFIVVALGEGGKDKLGYPTVFHCKPGDRIIVNKYVGTELVIDKQTYRVVENDDVVAIVKQS